MLNDIIAHYIRYNMTKGGDNVYEDKFPLRLAQLRTEKGVSARDMSISIGQNHGYINNIESGKSLPAMQKFFFICDFLTISPKDFFDIDAKNTIKIQEIMNKLKLLNNSQLEMVDSVIKELLKK